MDDEEEENQAFEEQGDDTEVVDEQDDDKGHIEEKRQHAHDQQVLEDATDKVNQLVGTIVVGFEAHTEARLKDTSTPNQTNKKEVTIAPIPTEFGNTTTKEPIPPPQAGDGDDSSHPSSIPYGPAFIAPNP